MEGLLPFLYRAILLHLADGGGQAPAGDESSTAPYYVRLAGGNDVPVFLSTAARSYYDR